jgi:hypothetical protein
MTNYEFMDRLYLGRSGTSTVAVKKTETLASDVKFDPDMMHERLLDGRESSAPIEWFPRLRNA